MAVLQGQRLGQGQVGVLGGGIGKSAEGREERSRGSRLQEVPAPSPQPSWQECSGRIDVSHEVDLEGPVPLRVRHLHPAGDEDTGIGAEQVDGSELTLHEGNQFDGVLFDGHVVMHRSRPDLVGQRGGVSHIGNDDPTRAVGREPPTECLTGTLRPAGDDDDLVGDVHPPTPPGRVAMLPT